MTLSPPPKRPPAGRDRSTFLQRTAKGDVTGANGWLTLAAIVIGAVVGLYDWDLFAGILAAMGAFVGLTVAYAVLSWLCGWPRPNWMAFIATILDFLSGW